MYTVQEPAVQRFRTSLHLLNDATSTFQRTCAERSAQFLADEEVTRFLSERNVSADELYARYRTRTLAPDCQRDFAIFLEESHIGHCSLHMIETGDRSASLTIVLGDRSKQQKGLGGEVMLQLEEYARSELELSLLWLTVSALQGYAVRFYRDLGYRPHRFGIQKGCWDDQDGNPRDSWCLAKRL